MRESAMLSAAWSVAGRLVALLAVLVLAACGGGGDSSETRISADRSLVIVQSGPVEAGPAEIVKLRITSLPDAGLYGGATTTYNGVASVDLYTTSDTAGELAVSFKPGLGLADGTYTDTVEINLCYDNQCLRPVAGSPLRIETRYTITTNSVARIDQTAVSASAATADVSSPVSTVTVTTSGSVPASTLYFRATADGYPVHYSTEVLKLDDTTTKIEFRYNAPSTMNAGTFEQATTIHVCYDFACTREVSGSPMRVTVRYVVSQSATVEVGVTPLAVSSRTALAHDVVDAEFSRALNAVVMVSSWPTNALHIYDVGSGAERTLALNKVPMAVSLSPDGLSAAVGHDALVTHVDLASVGTASPLTRALNLSAVTGDLVLDGSGHVYVFPLVDQWVSVHSIDVATNTEVLQYGPRAGTKARLHPSGTRIYGANNGLSPDDIENYDIRSGVAVRVADSPYHGDYPMCGNVWPSDDGALLFTACGRAFRASEVSGNDMVYAGALTLSTSQFYGWHVLSLSHLYATRQIALIEQPWYECNVLTGGAQCFSHLVIYESDFLNRQAVYSIPPVAVASHDYPQQGLFVFHQTNGTKVLISRLTGMPNPAAEYYLSLLP